MNYHGSPLDLLVRPHPGATTAIVAFHAALQPEGATRPIFTGVGLTEGLPVHQIFVSDPSLELDDELLLAWFVGNRSQSLQQDLTRVLKHLLDALGVEHVVFFGPSGGGFAALYYSWFFPGSLAVAANPQVVLEHYEPRRHLARFGRVCLGVTEHDQLGAAMAGRSVVGDMRDLYAVCRTNTVAYLQNRDDRHHIEQHMMPLLKSGIDLSTVYLLLGAWGSGHVAPPRSLLTTLLDAVCASEGRWGTALTAQGFASGAAAEDLLAALEVQRK